MTEAKSNIATVADPDAMHRGRDWRTHLTHLPAAKFCGFSRVRSDYTLRRHGESHGIARISASTIRLHGRTVS